MQTKGIGRLAALLLAALLALVLLPGAALAAAPDGMTITPETAQEEIDEHFGAGYLQIGEVGGVCTLTVLQDINMDGVNPLNLGVRLGGDDQPMMVLELNGKTIEHTTMALVNYGSLTIRDSTGGGCIRTVTTNDVSQYSTISNNGYLIVESGTFERVPVDAVWQCPVIGASMDTTTVIKGGVFTNKGEGGSALTTYGDVTISGGEFNGTYGVVAQPGSNSGSPVGVVTFTEDSAAVVNAGKMAFVIQKNKGREGIINAQGGVFNAPRVAGQIGGANIQQQISITGGTYEANPAAWADEGTPVAQLTLSGRPGGFVAGVEDIRQAAAGVSKGDEIDVLSGDVALTNLPDGVTVKNSGGGTVSANGEDVAAGDSYTVETPLAIRITAQPRDAIVTEGETATFTIAVEGGTPYYQWRKSTDGGRTFAFIAGENGASYTTSATTVENDGYRYDCLVIEEADKDSLADLESLAPGRDYVKSNAATLTVKAAEEEPAPGGEDDVPPTGEGPLLYVALGVAALCLLGLALPALRRGNRG